ncbi:cobaltochelatase subunit CobN [Porphyromonadaceae bacterium W3.11]|nr:cobaltochelatase subunit CobN [Porphyromonadaceae bacterium W3.11]
MKKRSLVLGGVVLLAVLIAVFFVYRSFIAPTKIALIHFPSYQVSNLVNANDDWQTKVEVVNEDEASHLPKYDVILIFGAGFRPTPEQQVALEKAKNKGIPIYSYVMRSNRIQNSNITEEQDETLDQYYKYRSQKNFRNLLRFIRAELDGRKLFSKKPEKPQILPEDLFYHLDNERFFLSTDELVDYLRAEGLYHEHGPKIALISGTLAPLEGNRAYVDTLINGLMSRGYNVYPFISSEHRLEILDEINPDALIYIPMGRLASNDGDVWLKEKNIPIFCPIPVNQTEKQWVEDKIGLSAGSLTARVTLAELDGGLLPMVISTENEVGDNLVTVEAQPEGIKAFMDTVERYMNLKYRKNADKKIAIVYFRGAGNNSLVATGLEVVPSLYNFLKRLQAEGYNVSGLPASLTEFRDQIMKQGAVWGNHTEGMLAKFIEKENPELIKVSDYERWAKKMIQPTKYKEVTDLYGEAPGSYMNTSTPDGEPAIAVARLRYGNVTILPQQMSSFTEDQFKMVHGVELPPPHSYLAPYLWIKEGFGADAIIHFGTHGNLEFTPGKQVALSHYDWSKALISDLPHFYYYSISNVGESVIAKRRAQATIVSYLTPPFMESRTRGQYQELFHLLEHVRMDNDRVSGLKFKEECIRLNLHKDLQLDDDMTTPYTEDEVIYIENFLEEIANEKMTGKLYTLGESYSPAEVDATAMAMSIDGIAYQCAQLDKHLGKITQEQYESQAFMSKKYLQPLTALIRQNLSKGNTESLMSHLTKNVYAKDSTSLALVDELKSSVQDLFTFREQLESSPSLELDGLIRGLNGGYIAPGPGGDAVRSPNALPTGRNLFSINVETTPTEKAWNTGKDLANKTLETYLKEHGTYPNKISYTFWAGEFIESEGATIAQVMYMLGVEPIRDRRGRVVDLRLIPASDLGRPRIDVVIQVSGQLRDLATSRLILLNRAIELAASATDDVDNNFVRHGSIEVERQLIEKGTPPAKARELANMRLFGGLNGRYGTGIKELVEKGDAWEDRSEIASTYMKNMGAIYGTEEEWGAYHEHLLEVALSNTDIVVQPRQNNTWGALSLDHMYEFMGGISNAVEDVTGKAPEMYLADYRNRFRPRMQGLKEAIGVESRTTIFNPEYIKEKMKGAASSANTFAKTIRNSYGWEAMRADALDDSFWDKVYEVYVQDEFDLNVQEYFEQTNPAALQEIAAVMLETSRKGMWSATPEQVASLAELYSDLTIKYGPSGSEFSDSNAKLQEYIMEQLPKNASEYKKAMMEGAVDGNKKAMVLEEDKMTMNTDQEKATTGLVIGGIAIGILLLTLVAIVVRRKKRS